MIKHISSYICIALAAILFTACSNTKMLSSWRTESLPNNTMDKVLIFSLLGIKGNNDVQDDFEDAIVSDLHRNGINAYSAYDIYGSAGLKSKSKETLAKEIHDGNYTGVMIITLLDKKKETNYVPGSTYNVAVPIMPYGFGFYHYYNCYGYYYDQVTTPGYYTTDTEYILEARIFNTQDAKDAIYIGKTSTMNPSDAESMAKDFSNTITHDLFNQGIIQNKKYKSDTSRFDY